MGLGSGSLSRGHGHVFGAEADRITRVEKTQVAALDGCLTLARVVLRSGREQRAPVLHELGGTLGTLYFAGQARWTVATAHALVDAFRHVCEAPQLLEAIGQRRGARFQVELAT